MNSAQTYSVLLLEDEKPTRDYLASVIDACPGLTLYGGADCCCSAREQLRDNAPDVLVADLGLPDGSGINIIREARELHPEMEVLVLTVCEDEASVVAALEAGATGYLLKEQAFDELGDTILALMRGESAISPKVARFLLKRFTAPAQSQPDTGGRKSHRQAVAADGLTRREGEVLKLIARGYSYNEIAESLQLSTNTIRVYIRNIYRKLAVKSRSEAVFEAAHLGLISFEDSI
ncbi:MAG: response regulator transcription factor [Mariprofundaceae bacterium]|nr:response regulator transcription factor [Mariprofundaceae bacterium]